MRAVHAHQERGLKKCVFVLSVTLCTPTELIELLKLFKMEDLNSLYHADVMEWPLFCCTLTSLQETLPAILSFSLVGLYPLWST